MTAPSFSVRGAHSQFVTALAVAVALLSASVTAHARGAAAVDELIRLSGTNLALDGFPEAIKTGLDRVPTTYPRRAELVKAATEEANVAFAPKALLATLTRHLSSSLADADVEAMTKFYQSPLGTRMTELERVISAPGTDEKIQAAIPEIEKQIEADPKRAEAIVALIDALKLVERTTDISLATTRAMALGLAAGVEKGELPVAKIDADMAKARPQVTAQMATLMPVMVAYCYREASVDELTQYHAALTTPVGLRFNEALIEALTQALVVGSRSFGEGVGKRMQEQKL